MANKQLTDFLTAENPLDGNEDVYIAQGGKTRKTLLQRIKEFVIGTSSMGTTATDVTGAVKEVNDKVGAIDVATKGDVASQLNDITQKEIDIALVNGWKDYENGYRTMKVIKMGDLIIGNGVLTGGTSDTIGYLPEGSRPSATVTSGNILIGSDGVIISSGAGGKASYQMDFVISI